jgi:hypothetical protein
MAKKFYPKGHGLTKEVILSLINDHIDIHNDTIEEEYFDDPEQVQSNSCRYIKRKELTDRTCQRFVNEYFDLRDELIEEHPDHLRECITQLCVEFIGSLPKPKKRKR